MAVQIGRKKQVPIYGETTITGEILSSTTVSNYFTIIQGSSYGWTYNIYDGTEIGIIIMTPDNIGVNSSTATITFEAVRDLPDVRMDYMYYTENNYDKITVSIGDETLLDGVSGIGGPNDPTANSVSYKNLVKNRTIYQGEKITLKYVKNSSNSHTYESYTKFQIQCSPYTETITTITGYEEKLLPQTISNLYLSPTKKVIGGWIKASSGAKQFYSNESSGSVTQLVSFTGTYTRSVLNSGSYAGYSLYTLTSSGSLTTQANAQVWVCGGGANGDTATRVSSTNTYYYGGVGGSGGFTNSGTLSSGTYSVTIGASGSDRGGTTSVGFISAAGGYCDYGNNPDGGSAGGKNGYVYGNSTDYYIGCGTGTAPTGAGVSTYPFGITSLKAHCAGGGGGGAAYRWTTDSSVSNAFGYQDGSAGGSNGSDGGATSGTYRQDSQGGDYGGGNGGAKSAGSNATFYGAGGGGGASNFGTQYAGGSGYQGVAYILIQE